jgi:predicted nuclease of predicted toxin-antitoxin system
MSLGLYMDVHVPLPITRGLRRRGVDVLTAQDDCTTRFPDADLLRRARERGRILFSQDEDLIVEAVQCQRTGTPFATVVFARHWTSPLAAALPTWRRSPNPLCRKTPRAKSFSCEAPDVRKGVLGLCL